jgi:3-oxoacyl-[acyl-carrier protein] reductase
MLNRVPGKSLWCEGADVAAQKQPGAALITGGGRGIGRAITLRLVRVAPVLVVGRDLVDLESVCAEVRREGAAAEVCAGDISDPATASRAVALAVERGWEIGYLVCNAGIGKSGATETFDPQLWRRIFDVNVHGCFYFVQACLPGMLQRGRGTITIMSSLAGVTGV